MLSEGSKFSPSWAVTVALQCTLGQEKKETRKNYIQTTMHPKRRLSIWLNGREFTDKDPDPTESLISFIRRQGFTGTKLGCSEGGCGSCTVVVSSYDRSTGSVQHKSVNSCLLPACAADGKNVVTIEGIGSVDRMHPVQEKIADAYGSQCGFCTPGIAMSLFATLKNNPNASEHEIEESFDGNLCRCTGYRSILDGAKKLARKRCDEPCSDNGYCTSNATCDHKTNGHDVSDIEDIKKQQPDATEMPEKLLNLHKNVAPSSYFFDDGEVRWYRPVRVDELLDILDEHPQAKIINGNSEVGIETRFKNQRYPVLVYPAEIQELLQIHVADDGIEIGAATTIATMQAKLKELCTSLPEFKQRGIVAVLDNIRWFAGNHIRNVAAIAGNIVTASPISDLNPVFVALGAFLTVKSKAGGVRKISMREFFLGYRKTALRPSEVVLSIYIPFSKENEFVKSYKQARRKDDDIAIVNACMNVSIESNENGHMIKEACLAFGGLGPTTVIAAKTCTKILGQRWTHELIDLSAPTLLEDFPLAASAPGGQIEFRKALALSFFQKFQLHVSSKLSQSDSALSISSRDVSSLLDIERGVTSGSQEFVEAPESEIVGRSMLHASAYKQVTGTAIYIDDIPKLAGELAIALVGSTVAHGRILSVDTSKALEVPGVVGYVCAKDVPGDRHNNLIGPVAHDEELFATEIVLYMGQPIGAIVADTEKTANYASKLVKIEYERLEPIFTIEEAIAAKSFFDPPRKLQSGCYAKNEPLNNEGLVFVEGSARIAGQEHFYLETQASLVVPKQEDNELEVFASTQHPSETQHLLSHVLGIPSNRIVVRVKRLGGGFGGKESRSAFLTCILAVAARKFRAPIRHQLTREQDMAITGTRHPFLGRYRVGVDKASGRLASLQLELYSNGGFSADLSYAVLERAMTHSDNTYRIPNVDIIGRICKTNLPTNTAFRGFGGPQGMMVAEQWINHVADVIGRDVNELRVINFYKNGDVTHFSNPLDDYHFERVWSELLETSDFEKRKKDVLQFNKDHRYRKRGIALLPTKFGLSFTARHLNQAGALVHVYIDGSVLVTHGGTEMGQGLHTKMIQIAAQAFSIPVSMVHLSETSTNTVANTSATAASFSSDLNGMAVLDACTQILNRLKPLQEKYPEESWNGIIKKAYFDRVNLSANGFFKTPDLSYDWATNTGRMFSYFTYGAACAEVEIDTLTGDHTVRRADVVMDIGTPINPSIDVGQIEGAFAQGMGWSTIEEPLISPTTGFLLTRGPGAYKIPGFRDVPEDLRIRIIKGSRNARAVHSSKAIGEPPLFMGASVFFALKEAVRASREENGLGSGHFAMSSPATSERIRLLCGDRFVGMAATPLKVGEKPFSVTP
ncbi:molybdopterin binding aldehyde oxidase/xanthine dehydrogenase [Zopfochytrium polystomum]|nr:molybdopterin binding aldehyde oxidase/xanthine dehydrogenase [Zopfochytrium polystomum]